MGSRSASSDEGEIVETGGEELKATTLPVVHGNGVDRQNRNRGRNSRSPGSDRSRSHGNPSHRTASPRGFKRSRDERDSRHQGGGRGGSDPRRFRTYYEDTGRDDYQQSRNRHRDDRPTSGEGSNRHGNSDFAGSRGSRGRYGNRNSHYDDRRDGYPDKRARTRSRSPHESSRNHQGRRDRGRREPSHYERRQYGEQAESTQYSAHNPRWPRDDPRFRGATGERATVASGGHAKFAEDAMSDHRTESTTQRAQQPAQLSDASRGLVTGQRRDVEELSKSAETENQQEWEEKEPFDEEAEIRRRRQRREERLRKSRASTPMHLLALQADRTAPTTPADSTQISTPLKTESNTPRSGIFIRSARPVLSSNNSVGASPMSPAPHQDPLSPDALDLASDQELINKHGTERPVSNDEDGPSAADYDPTFDMQEDGRRDELRHGNVGLHGEEHRESVVAPPEKEDVAKDTPSGAKSDDEDDFDMFADDFDEDKYVAPNTGSKAATAVEKPRAQPQGGGILEGDDKDGYYKIRPGEVLNGRYQIQSTLGKGMFSGVARAQDLTTSKLVAIKIMRNNDALRKGGFTEIAILQKLNVADPDNKKHIVKFERSFEYKGHLCMVFENLSLNLREVLKKFGNNVGINIKGVRVYAYQIFLALAHMRKCSIIHADLKPDNILVNDNRSLLKICDLGTAIDRSDAATAHNEITPYLVSRFYRAPEIILGIPYDYAADMWSIGCTLYEMYTGKILFTGDSNNQMLKAIMEIRGKVGAKLYRRGQLWMLHFDDLGNFVSQERDKMLGKVNLKAMTVVKPTRDLRTRLTAASSGMSDAESKELNLFHDLLERCLNVNPDKRISPLEALKHPFFTSRVSSSSKR